MTVTRLGRRPVCFANDITGMTGLLKPEEWGSASSALTGQTPVFPETEQNDNGQEEPRHRRRSAERTQPLAQLSMPTLHKTAETKGSRRRNVKKKSLTTSIPSSLPPARDSPAAPQTHAPSSISHALSHSHTHVRCICGRAKRLRCLRRCHLDRRQTSCKAQITNPTTSDAGPGVGEAIPHLSSFSLASFALHRITLSFQLAIAVPIWTICSPFRSSGGHAGLFGL